MKVVHFHNGTGGGVLSVIRNLLFYQQHYELENHVIYTINKELIKQYNKPLLKGAVSEQVFYYSPKWNFYYTCRQLAKLLPTENAVIVAHDWLELGMVSNLGLQNPLVQVLHGDFGYYYNLAFLHKRNVDQFICVSPVIERNLRMRMDSEEISFLRFPVPEVSCDERLLAELKIAFYVRDLREERKQMKFLPQIERELRRRNLSVEWHLAGGGMSKEQLAEIWGDAYSERVYFRGELDRNGIDHLLRTCNVMILPSLSEGYPVAVVEAMKYGLIPLVSYWDGAVSDLVVYGETGYTFANHDAVAYAECIQVLAFEPLLLHEISINAKKAADELFNPERAAYLYENTFLAAISNHKLKKSFKAYGSRLDHPRNPNCIVKLLRSILNVDKN